MSTEITVITQPKQTVYGLWTASGDKTIAKDIPSLSAKYYEAIGKAPGSVLPFVVLSRNYHVETGLFELFIGGFIQHEGLEAVDLPQGDYGKITVKPKLGFLWGPAIGQAKGLFYGKWLPASPYKALNMEYEYHTEKSVAKRPEIDLLFAIEKK